MAPRSWDDLKDEFEHVVFVQGAKKVAHAIPADPVTVYRLVKGESKQPSLAVLRGIERVVEEARDDDLDSLRQE